MEQRKICFNIDEDRYLAFMEVASDLHDSTRGYLTDSLIEAVELFIEHHTEDKSNVQQRECCWIESEE
jgi:hypothetical protein